MMQMMKRLLKLIGLNFGKIGPEAGASNMFWLKMVNGVFLLEPVKPLEPYILYEPLYRI